MGAPTDWSCKEAGAGSRYRVYDPGDRNDEGNSSYRSRSHSYNRTSGPRPESRSNVHDDDIFHTVIRDTVVPDTVILYGRIFLQRRKRHLGRQRVSCN